jgi:Zn-dependent peptidase ImmA (M78 family)
LTYNRASYTDKWRLERAAKAIRENMGLAPTDVLNPKRLADAIGAHVFNPEDLVPPQLAAKAALVKWDGFAFVFPGEKHLMVLLNPHRSAKRQSATLMEEIAHHFLQHEPSRLRADPQTGLVRRDFNAAQEAEAYDFGSVLLLPKELIQRHVKVEQGHAEDLADRCTCSVALVEFRIKRCGLWRRYLSYRD